MQARGYGSSETVDEPGVNWFTVTLQCTSTPICFAVIKAALANSWFPMHPLVVKSPVLASSSGALTTRSGASRRGAATKSLKRAAKGLPPAGPRNRKPRREPPAMYNPGIQRSAFEAEQAARNGTTKHEPSNLHPANGGSLAPE